MARFSIQISSSVAVLAVAVLFMALVGQSYGQLAVGFYQGKCKSYDVEKEIYSCISAGYYKDKTVVAALLRMLFHDSFGGCDASLLLDGAEKSAGPNQSVRGFDVIDTCKANLELKCPGVVSCTDIMVIATRSAVYLANGPWYNVETGRRDSLTSNAGDPWSLPSPTISVSDAVSKFAARQMTATHFALLLGAGHTVGIIHCNFFLDRLYNFQATGLPDPSMNKTTLSSLTNTCPSSGSTHYAFADQTPLSTYKFDSAFFQAIKQGKGLLQIDQRLASDPLTKDIVTRFANNPSDFSTLFAGAVNMLARYGALTGTNGQIRKNCHLPN